jgi:hypothetical protein
VISKSWLQNADNLFLPPDPVRKGADANQLSNHENEPLHHDRCCKLGLVEPNGHETGLTTLDSNLKWRACLSILETRPVAFLHVRSSLWLKECGLGGSISLQVVTHQVHISESLAMQFVQAGNMRPCKRHSNSRGHMREKSTPMYIGRADGGFPRD